jgi:hypothetical protein
LNARPWPKLIAAAAVLLSSCLSVPPVDDAASRLTRANRVVMIGEIHGTEEIPVEFGRIVEALSSPAAPMDVGLELPQGALTVNCGAGGPAPYWARPSQDGRTSAAMWHLVCRLRKLERGGRISLFGLVPDARPPDGTGHIYFSAVSSRLQRGDRRMILLLGNFHARSSPGSLASMVRDVGASVGAVTASSHSAAAWTCRTRAACGVQPVPAGLCEARSSSVRFVVGAEAGLGEPPLWDGCLLFPVLSASAPAHPAPSPTPSAG